MSAKDIAKNILENIGGKDNLNAISYCMTRVRLTVKNDDKVSEEGLKKIPGVMRLVKLGGQYQLVVGGIVNEVYEEIVNHVGDSVVVGEQIQEYREEDEGYLSTEDANKDKSIKGYLGGGIEVISSIISPIIPALLAAGFIKTIAMIMLNIFGVSETNTTFQLFNTLGDTLYYFFPMIIGWSAANRFNANIGVTLLMTGFLVDPSFASIFGEVDAVSFVGVPVTNVYYGSSVLPAILSVYLLAKLERFFRTNLPPALRSIFVPFLSLLIVFPLLITVIGPLGVWGGNLFASLFTNLYAFSPIIAGAVIGGTWQILIIFGMHIAVLGLVSGPNIAAFGRDTVIMTHAPSLICQVTAGLAVSLKAKNKKLKREALSLSLTSFMSGSVVEPVMYGINLKLKKPFIAVLIGGAVGGAITGAAGAGTTAAVAFSVYTFPAYLGYGFTGLLIGSLVGGLITFLLTYFMGFDEELYLGN